MGKSYRIEGSPSYPSYLGRDNFSYVSLLNLGNRLHDKQKFFSAGGVIHLAGPPIFHDIRTQFPYTNILVRPSGSTRSRRDNQNIHEQC